MLVELDLIDTNEYVQATKKKKKKKKTYVQEESEPKNSRMDSVEVNPHAWDQSKKRKRTNIGIFWEIKNPAKEIKEERFMDWH